MQHRHLFTQRQPTALTTFCDLVDAARDKIQKDASGESARADAVVTFLAMSVAKIANLGGTLASWMSDRGVPRNLLTNVGGGFATTLEKAAKVVEFYCSERAGTVLQLSATDIANRRLL